MQACRKLTLQMDKLWLRPPHSRGEPEEVEAKPEILVPRMVAGWSQGDPPEEVTEDVRELS